jgi:tetratricopeptide (TPR) repeat protein
LAERDQCVFSSSLVDWFDSGIWKRRGWGEYCQPIDPALLNVDAPEQIWPGLMSCDLIPLIGNGSGDWLCVRIDENSLASQVVQWYHGGGDWIPWGKDIAEAIIFDGFVDRISASSRRHAIPAIALRPDISRDHDDELLNWALSQAPESLGRELNSDLDDQQIAKVLLTAGVAEVAIHCELALKALCFPDVGALTRALGKGVAGISRAQLTEWAFDTARIPVRYRCQIESGENALKIPEQDWDLAASHARTVTDLAPESAWAWEILGYSAERIGQTDQAIAAYENAARCSVFTDQSVRMNTHWTSDDSSKFCVGRIQHLSEATIQDSEYLCTLSNAECRTRGSVITEYWNRQAVAQLAVNDREAAHRSYMAAGWDLGAGPITVYGEIIDRICETASNCGQHGRAAVAATHRRCLKERYGI